MAKTNESPMPIKAEIQDMIYVVRGQQVMIDKDLAALYGVETAQLNRQVKRNIDRFPDDFMFQLNKEETENLKCQIGMSSWGGDRHQPYAFTENGVAMLSGVLRSPTAIKVNIQIMRAFNAMRQYFSYMDPTNQTVICQRFSTLEYHQLEMQKHQDETDKRLDEVFRRLDEGQAKPQQGVFYDGQIYDAYTFVADLVKSAKHRIILIDNYIDETVLTLLDKRDSNVSAIIYTQQISRQLRLDIDRHNAQYRPVEVKHFCLSHDRFLCIDESVYHIGASIKDLGKKWFGFSKMEVLSPEELVERINRS